MKALTHSIALAALMCLASPAYANDKEVMANAEAMLKNCDTNGDGKLSKDEYAESKMKKFKEYDKNDDGALSKEEHEKMVMDMHKMVVGEKS